MSTGSKRVLIVATVVKTHIMQFHIPTLKLFKDMGWETAVAARNDYANPDDCKIPYCDQFYDIPFERMPFMPKNVNCYKRLKDIIDQGNYQIIHCHTPVGGVLGRLAARKARKKGTRVLYTAHGFHFYRGAPLKNWLMYYPVEKICSYFADAILTINREDLDFAKKHFHHPRILYLPGIGVDMDEYSKVPGCAIDFRMLFDLHQDEKVLISVGEMTENKNHKTIIKALTLSQLKNVHYVIVGSGVCRPRLEKYAARLKISDRVHFLGYRRDIASLLHASDVFVFPSYREGLPVALIEAMASGLPCVASRIRGNVDLIEDGVNGFLCDPRNALEFAEKIALLANNAELREKMGRTNRMAIQQFSTDIVIQKMQDIYAAELLGSSSK